jgi:integrase/recombinase XerD
MIHDGGEETGDHFALPLPNNSGLSVAGLGQLPGLIVRAGDDAVRRFVEFFTATIRNRNTRAAYAQAVGQFCSWCERRQLELNHISPVVVATYIEELTQTRSAPTVKQHLAAIRMLFDWLVTGHVVPINPAWSVRGPKHVVKKGKTPVLTSAEARQLLDSIDAATVVGIRDRALIGLMCYSFARVSAVIGMNVEDYYQQGKRAWFRLHEKGGKFHEVPAHHNAELYLDEYLAVAGIAGERKDRLFRSGAGKSGLLTPRRMTRTDVLRMVKRRSLAAGIDADRICCHTFRATGITAYLENGGTIEGAQAIAAHESPRTTKLYDRTSDELTLDEIERIAI